MKLALGVRRGTLLAFFALSKSQNLPPCGAGVNNVVVASTAQAVDLSEDCCYVQEAHGSASTDYQRCIRQNFSDNHGVVVWTRHG